MVKQINMEEYYRDMAKKNEGRPINYIKKLEDNLKGLTKRQIALKEFYDYFQAEHNYNPSDQETLTTIIGDIYDYHEERKRKPNTPFNDLTARRELTKDKNALAFHTGTTKVFIGNGYARSDWEIKKQILKYKSAGKKQFRKMAICQMKAIKNGQLGYDLHSDYTQTEIRKYESKVKMLDEEIKEIDEKIKNGDNLAEKIKKKEVK